MFEQGLQRELAQIRAVTGATVELTEATRASYQAGVRVARAMTCRSARSAISIRAVSDRAGSDEITVEEDVVSTWHDPALMERPADSVDLDGKELFVLSPQWARGVESSFLQYQETLDVQRGVTDLIIPEDFTTRRIRVDFMLTTDEHLKALIGLFYRHRGKQKSFHMSGVMDELSPEAARTGGGETELTFRGDEIFEAYHEQEIYRRLSLLTAGGETRHEISGLRVNAAGDTEMTLTGESPGVAEGQRIRRVSWIVLARFETDILTLRWVTSRVATASTAFRALERIE